MKPIKTLASTAFGQFVKPFAKKAVTAGVSHAGERVGKMAADKAIEKSGKLIRKRLLQGQSGQSGQRRGTEATAKKENEHDKR